jgi:hypothetical protein
MTRWYGSAALMNVNETHKKIQKKNFWLINSQRSIIRSLNSKAAARAAAYFLKKIFQ